MGTDLWAEESTYQCSTWKWPHIWAIVCTLAEHELSAEQCIAGYYNDHCEITAGQAKRIARVLRYSITNGVGLTSIRVPDHVTAALNALTKNISKMGLGNNKQPTIKIDYDDLEELAEFMENSGGFTIS